MQQLLTDQSTATYEEAEPLKISSGSDTVDRSLKGGISTGMVSLIEGPSGSGKSVLAEHLVFGALLADLRVSFYISGRTINAMMAQMAGLSLDVTEFIDSGQLSIFPMDIFRTGRSDSKTFYDSFLDSMIENQGETDVAIVDSLSDQVTSSTPTESVKFLIACKELADEGLTTIVSLHTSAFTPKLLWRFHHLFDAHISLTSEGQQKGMQFEVLNQIEVKKVNNIELSKNNTLHFKVDPELGRSMNISLDVIPLFRFTA